MAEGKGRPVAARMVREWSTVISEPTVSAGTVQHARQIEFSVTGDQPCDPSRSFVLWRTIPASKCQLKLPIHGA
jgi:hypothetical protein